ncbi:MAG: hypothetical protein ACK46X_00305 [Candidatus Sericytochromatia bacterium]
MGDFRIDRRGTHQPGNVSKRQPQQRPAEPTPGGNQGALNGFGDVITPELAERLRERRERQPHAGPGRGPQQGPHAPHAAENGEMMPPMGRWHGRHGHPPMPGGPGEGHGPMGRPGRPHGPDADRPFVGRQPVDPAKAAEDLFTKLDTNGDGAVTKDEVTAFFEAQQARRQPAAPAEPVTEEAVVEAPVADEAIAETPVVDETTEILPEETALTQAELYAQAQAQAISELQAFAAQEGLPEEFLALATQVMDAIYALDPADAEFETRLNAAVEPLQTALASAAAEG